MDESRIELIMALAEGRLPAEDARALERTLSTEERSELEAQRAALAALTGLERPTMTAVERTRLHDAVDAAAARIPVPGRAPGPAAPSRRVRWSSRLVWAGATAAVIGLAAVSAVTIAGSGGDDASDVATEAETTTTTEASLAAVPAPADAAVEEFSSDTTTTVAAAGDVAGGERFYAADLGEESEQALRRNQVFSRPVPLEPAEDQACFDIASQADPPLVGAVAGRQDGRATVVFLYEPGADPEVIAYFADTCEVAPG